MSRIGYWVQKGRRDGTDGSAIFYSLKLFPCLLSFLNILQPPLLGLVPFFSIALGVLFWASALQGLKGPSSS